MCDKIGIHQKNPYENTKPEWKIRIEIKKERKKEIAINSKRAKEGITYEEILGCKD